MGLLVIRCRPMLHMSRRLFATILVLTAAPAEAQENDVWRACSIDNVVMCTPAGCSTRRPTISIYIGYHSDHGIEHAVYLRCKVAFVSCDRYDPVVHRAGSFVIFSLPEHSAFSKLQADNRLTDVAAVQDTVFISRGQCALAAPPLSSSWRSWRD